MKRSPVKLFLLLMPLMAVVLLGMQFSADNTPPVITFHGSMATIFKYQRIDTIDFPPGLEIRVTDNVKVTSVYAYGNWTYKGMSNEYGSPHTSDPSVYSFYGLEIEPGYNQVIFYAKDAAGNVSQKTFIFYNVPVVVAPGPEPVPVATPYVPHDMFVGSWRMQDSSAVFIEVKKNGNQWSATTGTGTLLNFRVAADRMQMSFQIAHPQEGQFEYVFWMRDPNHHSDVVDGTRWGVESRNASEHGSKKIILERYQ